MKNLEDLRIEMIHGLYHLLLNEGATAYVADIIGDNYIIAVTVKGGKPFNPDFLICLSPKDEYSGFNDKEAVVRMMREASKKRKATAAQINSKTPARPIRIKVK